MGDRKTGSTAIQSTLAVGAWACDTVKLLYPVRGGSTHIALARTMIDADAEPQRQSHFDLIRREIDASQPDIALISAEKFESVDPEVLRDSLQRYMPEYVETARFVSYVRPHVDRTLSSYAEQTKQGLFHGSLAELHARLMRRKRFIYAPRFLKWAKVFGSNFILRPLVRDHLVNRDVVYDLLSITFGMAPFEIRTPPQSNESLGLEDLAMIRALQIRISEKPTTKGAGGKSSTLQHAFGWNFAARLAADPSTTSTKLRVHRDLALKMRDDYLPDARELDAAFFDGTPLTNELLAAPDRAVASAQSLDLADHFTPAEMRIFSVFSAQVSDLLKINPDHWEKFFRAQTNQYLTGKPKPE